GGPSGGARAHPALPICAATGVSTAEQAAAVAGFADGAIVGTALVRRLGDAGLDGLRALTPSPADPGPPPPPSPGPGGWLGPSDGPTRDGPTRGWTRAGGGSASIGSQVQADLGGLER